MKISDQPRFARAITATAAMFDKETDEAFLHGYWIALEDLPIERVELAMAVALRRCKWMPKPVEIRELAGETPVAERASEAWGEVLRLSSNCRAATHSDPVAENAIQKMGGWLSVGTRDADDLRVWGRKKFEELYRVLAESSDIREAKELIESGDTHPDVAMLASTLAGRKAMGS